jgi:hypothetical protein
MAYADVEPFGPPAAFWQAGIVAATIANVYRDKKKRPAPFVPADFMPDMGSDEPEPSPADRAMALRAKVDAVMAAFGGRKGKGKHRRA